MDGLTQAVCQMMMHGDKVFEKVLLQLNSPDDNQAAEEQAVAILNMFCLDCTGEPPSQAYVMIALSASSQLLSVVVLAGLGRTQKSKD